MSFVFFSIVSMMSIVVDQLQRAARRPGHNIIPSDLRKRGRSQRLSSVMQVSVPDLLSADVGVDDGRKVRRAEKLQRGIAKKVRGRPTPRERALERTARLGLLARAPRSLSNLRSQTRLRA